MLTVKGGSITCTCGWENDPSNESITLDTTNIETAIQAAYAWCFADYGGAAHCSGNTQS